MSVKGEHIKREPVDETAEEGAVLAAIAGTASPLASLPPQRDIEDDDDVAIEIEDVDAADGFALGTFPTADSLLGTTGVLTAGEEEPPLLTRDYAAAFLNTDPRISFDALHIGVLRAMEANERMTRSEYDYPSWFVPKAKYVAPTAAASGKPFFTVPAMHPMVQSRAPIDREDAVVDRLLYKPDRSTLSDAIGSDLLEVLRVNRSREVRRRQRRRQRESDEPPPKRTSSA